MKKINLGKKGGTLGIGNRVWIKKFNNGIKIRTKGEAEITLEPYEIYEMLCYLRKFCKKHGGSLFLGSVDLRCVWQKYPETTRFIERLIADEVSYEEQEKIEKIYITKQNILNALKDE